MSTKSVSVEVLEPISASLLRVGEALPYDLYNAKGKFISAKDYIFKNEMEVSMVAHAKPMRIKTDAYPTSENTSRSQTATNQYSKNNSPNKLIWLH